MRIIEKNQSPNLLCSARLELERPWPNDEPKTTRSGERPWQTGAARRRPLPSGRATHAAAGLVPPGPLQSPHLLGPARRLDDHVEGQEGRRE